MRIVDEVGVTDTVRVGLRSYYSTHLLAAAQDAANQAAELEAALLKSQGQKFSLKHRGLVLAAVIESAAFVEAAINEVLQALLRVSVDRIRCHRP